MPDAQSAVLLCLAWQASLQERMSYGPHAGRFLARLSGPQLAEMIGRPLRTVRHALRRLKESARICNEQPGAGSKAVYALHLCAHPGRENDALQS
jgi:hypothetical protein